MIFSVPEQLVKSDFRALIEQVDPVIGLTDTMHDNPDQQLIQNDLYNVGLNIINYGVANKENSPP